MNDKPTPTPEKAAELSQRLDRVEDEMRKLSAEMAEFVVLLRQHRIASAGPI